MLQSGQSMCPTLPCCAAPPIQNFEAVSSGVTITNSWVSLSYVACSQGGQSVDKTL